MPFYVIRPGRQLGHNGKTRHGGEVIELPLHVATEVREYVFPCLADGTVLRNLSPDELAVAQAQEHEQESVLMQQVTQAKEALKDAEHRLDLCRRQRLKVADTRAQPTTPVEEVNEDLLTSVGSKSGPVKGKKAN